jgi:hypothetical protein
VRFFSNVKKKKSGRSDEAKAKEKIFRFSSVCACLSLSLSRRVSVSLGLRINSRVTAVTKLSMEVMHSGPNSRSNSVVKLFRRRSTATTSGVGESLDGDDLEWDRSDFARHLPESDALSCYDVNEMAEILRNRFLEFDMSSQVGGRGGFSRQSTVSDLLTPMSNYDFTIEDFLQNRAVTPKLTFDIESLCEQQMIKRPFHRSLTELNEKWTAKNDVRCKHLSLMDIPSVEWTFLKHATPRALLLTKANYRTSFSQLPQSMEPEPEPFLSSSKASLNYSRLSRLAMIRLYMKKLREKLCSFVIQTIQPEQNSRMPVITEETIESYDIIDE